jgi:uncharacterized protein YbbC (DUF1343 family)
MKEFCFAFFFLILFIHCTTADSKPQENLPQATTIEEEEIIVGAARLDAYLPIIKNKKIALVVNQTSMINQTHLADSLLSLGIKIEKIFSPEHGFRGKADAGEKVKDGIDLKTGIPLISLYGKNKKPSENHLNNVDLVIFDIQDVGARFYTYISTMHEVMEACAENGVAFMVLDRPNPNGNYVDGPVLKKEFSSFVGKHPVPVVHGMTIGEYAKMINGQSWLANGIQCDLKVITCEHYDHDKPYFLPIKPSPNLPNNRAIYLYPSLCFFEGTVASAGRGTNTQFQVYGHPDFEKGSYSFTPISRDGAKNPKHKDKTCNGYDLSTINMEELHQAKALNLNYLVDFYNNFPDKENFFIKNSFFDKLAGGSELKKQIIAGKSVAEIRASWQEDLNAYKQMRKQYLLY